MKKLTDLQNSTWRLFITAHVRVSARIEAKLADAELPPLEWYDVLHALKEAPEHCLRLSDLAEKILLSRSNLTRLVDRLENAGLLCREACPTDRRGTYAVLTPEGLAMQKRMWTVYAKGIAEYFACYVDDNEATVLQQVLRRILTAAEESQNANAS